MTLGYSTENISQYRIAGCILLVVNLLLADDCTGFQNIYLNIFIFWTLKEGALKCAL